MGKAATRFIRGTTLTARPLAERTFSHWGLFSVPAERVVIAMTDLGLAGRDLVSIFEYDGRKVESRVPFDRDIADALGRASVVEQRIAADVACICATWDLDPASVEIDL